MSSLLRGLERTQAGSLRLLERTLVLKIILTTLLWAMPFLFFSRDLLEPLMGVVPTPLFSLRLLGWCYVALIVGYAAGLLEVRAGRMPWGIVAMGIVSNGGGAALLGAHLFLGAGRTLSGLAATMNWLSWIALVAITTGLAVGAVGARPRR